MELILERDPNHVLGWGVARDGNSRAKLKVCTNALDVVLHHLTLLVKLERVKLKRWHLQSLDVFRIEDKPIPIEDELFVVLFDKGHRHGNGTAYCSLPDPQSTFLDLFRTNPVVGALSKVMQ